MIVFHGPDGKTAAFPEETPQDKMQEALDNLWPQPEATYGAIAKENIKSIPIHAKRAIGGLAEGIVEGITGEQNETLSKFTAGATEQLQDTVGSLHTDDRSFKWYLNQASSSIAANTFPIALGLINPVAGAVAGGLSVGGESYVDYEGENSPRKALAAAATTGLAEGLFDLPVFKVLAAGPAKNAFMGYVRKLLGYQALHEVGTESIQAAIDETMQKNGSMGDLFSKLPQLGLDTAAIFALQSAMLLPLGLAGHGARTAILAARGHEPSLKQMQDDLLNKPVADELPEKPKPMTAEMRAQVEQAVGAPPGEWTDEQLVEAAKVKAAESPVELGPAVEVSPEQPLANSEKSNPENMTKPAEKPPVTIDEEAAEAAVAQAITTQAPAPIENSITVESSNSLLDTDSVEEVVQKVTTARDLAHWFSQKSKNPSFRHIAERIKDFIPENVQLLIHGRDKLPEPLLARMIRNGANGVYFEGKNGVSPFVGLIVGSKSDESRVSNELVAMHELMHAATSNIISTPSEQLNEGTRRALDELNTLRRRIYDLSSKGQPHYKRYSADVHELVAAAFTDTQFQTFLKGINTQEDENIWTKFVQILSKMLGIENSSALTEVMNLTDKMLTESVKDNNQNSVEVEQAEQEITTPTENQMGSEQPVVETSPTVTENSTATPPQEVVDTTEEEAQKVKPEEPTLVKKAKRKRAQKKAQTEDSTKQVAGVKEVVPENPKVEKVKRKAGKAEQGSATQRVQNDYAEYYMDPNETATEMARRGMTLERIAESKDFYSIMGWLNARVNQFFHTGVGEMDVVNGAIAKLFKDANNGFLEEEQASHLEEFAKFTKDVMLARQEQKELGVRPVEKTTSVEEPNTNQPTAEQVVEESEEVTTLDGEITLLQGLLDMAYNELMEKGIEIKKLEASEKAGGTFNPEQKRYLENERDELWDQISELENRLDDLKFEKACAEIGPGVHAHFINDKLRQARTRLKNRLFRSEVEENNIRVLGEKKDIPVWFEHAHSPTYAAKGDKAASDLIKAGIRAFMKWRWDVHSLVKRCQVIKSLLTEEQQKEVTKMGRQVQKGETPTSTDPLVRTAYLHLREVFNEVRDKARDYFRLVLKSSLKENELQAFETMIESGQPPELIGLLFKINPQILSELKERWDAIGKWGIEDFITNMERGSLRVVELYEDKKGKTKQRTVAFAPTKTIAVRKIMERYEQAGAEGKEAPKLAIDVSPVFDDSMLVEMGKKRYQVVVSKLSKALKKEVDEVKKSLVESKVRKAVGKVITVKPNLVYSGAFQEREEILQGEDNIFDIMPTYINTALKKINLDPHILKAREYVADEATPRNYRTLIEDHIKDMKSTYGMVDRFVDDLLARAYSKTGWKVFDRESGQYARGIAEARKLTANLKLGYRPVTSFINMASGMINTYSKVPAKLFGRAMTFMKTEEGKALIDRNRPYLGEGFAVSESGELMADIKKWHPLWFHQAPEAFNREHCFCANYLYAKAQGMDEEAATYYAQEGVWAQQFVYNVASLPKLMRSPTGRLVSQFKPYLVKQLELFSNMTTGEKVKFLSAQMLLGGPRAMLLTLRSVPILGMFVGWDEIDEWLNTHYPHLYRGVPGSLGPASVDVSAQAAFQMPQQPMDWLGPLISDMFKLQSRVLGPLLAGRVDKVLPSDEFTHPLEGELNFKELRRREIYRWVRDAIPFMYYWDQILSYAFDDEGYILDDLGRRKFNPQHEWLDVAKLVAGAKTPEQSAWENSERKWIKDQQKIREDKQNLQATILDTIEVGGTLDADIIEKCKEYGVTYEGISQVAKARRLTPYMRRVLATQLVGRPAALQQLYQPPGQ